MTHLSRNIINPSRSTLFKKNIRLLGLNEEKTEKFEGTDTKQLSHVSIKRNKFISVNIFSSKPTPHNAITRQRKY